MRSRVEHIGNATLYLCDCRDIQPTLETVGAVVTDPPYGVPVMLRSDLGARGPAQLKNGRDWGELRGNDLEFDPGIWLQYDECLIWGANHFSHRLPSNGRWLVWDKRCGVVPQRTQADCEFAWVRSYGAARMFRFLWDGVCQDEKKGPRLHPTEKPIRVMEWCFRFISSRIVIDPFMGSGTTGVAAIRLGRRFIGIEIEERWFDVARRRIEAEARQGQLPFDEVADAIGSYHDAVAACGARYKAGEPLGDFFREEA